MTTSLRLLVQRWRQQGKAHAAVTLSVEEGLRPWPHLNLEGGYENLETAISELQNLSQELQSGHQLPTDEELKKLLAAPAANRIEPRCSPAVSSPSSLTPQMAAEALSSSSPPAVLIMGQSAPSPTEDE